MYFSTKVDNLKVFSNKNTLKYFTTLISGFGHILLYLFLKFSSNSSISDFVAQSFVKLLNSNFL